VDGLPGYGAGSGSRRRRQRRRSMVNRPRPDGGGRTDGWRSNGPCRPGHGRIV